MSDLRRQLREALLGRDWDEGEECAGCGNDVDEGVFCASCADGLDELEGALGDRKWEVIPPEGESSR